jgi:hypothetical protein
MNQTGGQQMNDEQVLTAMRRSLIAETGDLAGMGTGRPAEAVIARGRMLRVRRRLAKGLSGVAAAAVALALALTLPLGGTGPRPVHVNLAAWSVNTNPGGTVTFKLKRLSDPARLQRVLAQAGVPAIVRWHQNCREPQRIVGAPAARIVSEKYVGGPQGRFERADGQLLPAYAYTITPSAMAKGTRFVISAGRLPASERHNPHIVGPWIDWALVPAGVSVTCGPAVPPEVG